MTSRFVALAVHERVRAELDGRLAPVRGRWPDHAWTDPAGWHVTLAFLGELPDALLPEVGRAVEGAVGRMVGQAIEQGRAGGDANRTVPVTGLSLGPADRFGDRVLVVRVLDEPDGAVAEMGERIQLDLEAAGLTVHRRTVQAHLTLARARRRAPVHDELVAEVEAVVPGGARWSIASVGVWSSHRGRGPARYEVDTEVALSS